VRGRGGVGEGLSERKEREGEEGRGGRKKLIKI